MSNVNVNDNAIRIEKLLKEHLRLDLDVNAIDVQIAMHQADIDRLESQSDRYVGRQAEIAAEIAPVLTKLGHPVVWRHGRIDFVVSATADGGISIEEVKSWGHLASVMRPKMFTDAEITEAARHAAVAKVFGEDDHDPATWPAWTDAVLPLNGRTPTIANGVAVIDQEAS